MAKKGGSQQAPIVIQPKKKAQPKKVYGGPSASDLQQQQQDYIAQQKAAQADALAKAERENQRRKEEALQGQAKDIVNTQLNQSRTQSRLYGTRFKSPDEAQYAGLVTKEFNRLLKMDSGEAVEDKAATARKKKYEGFKMGRGFKPESLGEKSLLGN